MHPHRQRSGVFVVLMGIDPDYERPPKLSLEERIPTIVVCIPAQDFPHRIYYSTRVLISCFFLTDANSSSPGENAVREDMVSTSPSQCPAGHHARELCVLTACIGDSLRESSETRDRT